MSKHFTLLIFIPFLFIAEINAQATCATAFDVGIADPCGADLLSGNQIQGFETRAECAEFVAFSGSWFTFTTGNTTNLDIRGTLSGNKANPSMAVFSGSCGALVLEGTLCNGTTGNFNTTTALDVDLLANTQYWVFIASGNGGGTGIVSMDIINIDPNSFIGAASPLVLGTATPDDFCEADGFFTFSDDACGVITRDFELWYSVTIPAGGCYDLTVSVNNYTEADDISIEIFHDGTACASPGYYYMGLACGDANTGTVSAVSTENNSTSGSAITHLVRVTSNTGTGTFDITASISADMNNLAAGSSCASPQVLTQMTGGGLGPNGSDAYSTSNSCAGVASPEDGTAISTDCTTGGTLVGTADSHFTALPGATCDASMENTQYFTFQVPTTDIYNIFIGNFSCGATGGLQFFITDVLDCANSANTAAGVLTDTGAGTACSSVSGLTTKNIEVSLTTGTDYYIVTDGFAGDICDYDILITTTATDPLPIELYSFTGMEKGNTNYLEWITSAEINNSHFEIEFSTDGNKFEVIGYVEGQGNSSREAAYSFLHENPSADAYYRLKQVDFDGSSENSDIINISRKKKEGFVQAVFPNPSHGQSTIRFYSESNTTARISIYNVIGEKIQEDEISTDVGMNEFEIDISKFSNGIYFIDAQLSDKERDVIRLFKG